MSPSASIRNDSPPKDVDSRLCADDARPLGRLDGSDTGVSYKDEFSESLVAYVGV